MPRIGLFNIIFGFLLIFIAAMAGAFVSFDLTQGYLKDPELLGSWQMTLQSSAHGHVNMFGMLHILMGLTIPYNPLSSSVKVGQTIGLGLGAMAMGPFLLYRAALGPTDSFDFNGLLVGVGLSAAFVALAGHCWGLSLKFLQRAR